MYFYYHLQEELLTASNGRETILSAKNRRKGYWIFESLPQCHFSQKSIAKDCNTIQLINAVSALPTIEYKDEGMVCFYVSVVAVHSHRNYLSCSHINIPHYYYFRRYVIDFVPAFQKLAMNRREFGHLEFVSLFEAALSRSNNLARLQSFIDVKLYGHLICLMSPWLTHWQRPLLISFVTTKCGAVNK